MAPTQALPIEAIRNELVAACQTHRRFIVEAPTGSGKSTRIPGMLLDAGLLGDGRVVVLQPRRLAARMLASRVAHERRLPLGQEVGYQIRFDNQTSAATRIVYETEGLLLRQWLNDPNLTGISAILFDEFHERHLYGDLTLARALAVQRHHRPDLLLGVMSATLDTAPLQAYLDPCAVCRSAGRTFPVTIEHWSTAQTKQSIPDEAARTVDRWLRDDPPGDVLIFMPGAYEINRTLRALESGVHTGKCVLLPLHGELPPARQDAAMQAYDTRKIIVATNIAETSLTIEGVRLVVDSGLARVPRFDPHRGINTLWIERISRAAADQRAGRAGRTAPGHCIRCWTEPEHAGRALHDTPEIQRLDLAEAILHLKAAGETDLAQFPWFEAPPVRAVEQAEQLLADLGAIATAPHGPITPLGQEMVEFPVHPRYARMLIEARTHRCVRAAALVAALAQGRSLWTGRATRELQARREDALGTTTTSDFFQLIRAWNYARHQRYRTGPCQALGIHAQAARQVEPVYRAFLKMTNAEHADERAPEDDVLARCILAGFADRVAMREPGASRRYHIVHGRKGQLSRDSAIQDAPLVVASEIDEIERAGEGEVVLTAVTAIKQEWLETLFPAVVQSTTAVYYDRKTKRVMAEQQLCYHDLVLHTAPAGPPPREEAARLLAAACVQGHIPLHHWDAAVEHWIHRCNYLARTCPDLGLPTIGEAERQLVIEQCCWGHDTAKAVRNQPVWPAVKGLLSSAQLRLLDQHAPERLKLKGTRAFRLTYGESGPPVLAATIQELLPCAQLPPIACGRETPLLHILAPNRRPVQVTQDLPGFWRTHYPRIRQELKRRYPKHAWPEKAPSSHIREIKGLKQAKSVSAETMLYEDRGRR